MINQNFLWLAAFITVGGNIFYLVDTIKGKSQPNRVTFFLWGAAPLITYFAQRSGGAGAQMLYTLAVALPPLIILATSFVDKRAYWKITKFDIACGILSMFALIFLLFAGHALLALVLSIVADVFAGLPTIIKSYRHPESETAITYAIEIVGTLIVLLTIQNWAFVDYSFAVYVLFMNILFTALLIMPHKKPTKAS